MALLQERLSELRNSISSKEVFSFSALQPMGIPRGGITEISGTNGSGKTLATLRFLAEHPTFRVAWIEEEFSAYPNAFPQAGVSLNRVLFAEAGTDALWSTHQILRSRLFEIVVLSMQKNLEQVELRRLQLASEQARSSLILLSEHPTAQGSWALSLQMKIKERKLNVIKGKTYGTKTS